MCTPISIYVNADAVVNTTNIMNCGEPRAFWVGWVNGVIKVGRGYRYNRLTVLKFKDQNPFPVESMSISTGWGAYGEWKFEEFISKKRLRF